MDGSTEPVILVLGHPIAGNPAQFALERAFRAMELEWRVLSRDVPPWKLKQAIHGAAILGFDGLLLDRNLTHGQATGQGQTSERGDDDLGIVDCFFHAPDAEPEQEWQSESAMMIWLESQIRSYFQVAEDKSDSNDNSDANDIGPLLWIGPTDARFPAGLSDEQSQSPIAWASAESIEHADLIAITQQIDIDQWPSCQSQKLVVDLSMQPNDLNQIRSLGYKVIGASEIRIGILSQCIQRWTQQQPSVDILADAVEEYLAV